MVLHYTALVIRFLMHLSTVASLLMANSSRDTQDFRHFYIELLQQLMRDQRYESILLYSHSTSGQQNDCLDLIAVAAFMEIPIFLLNNTMNVKYMLHFNNEIVAIACLDSVMNYNLTLHLADTLDIMRYTRLIIQVQKNTNFSEVQQFFQYCHQLQLLNVMVIYGDFINTKLYHLYTVFPTFKMERHYYNISSWRRIFPDRLRDLKGYKLRTIINSISSRSFAFKDSMGKSRLRGYLGRFVSTFARMLNASLVMPPQAPLNVVLNYSEIMAYVHNKSVDIPASIVCFFPWNDHYELSYPVDIEDWCILLPIEQTMDVQRLFLLIMQSDLIVIMGLLLLIFTVVLFVAKYCTEGRNCGYQWPQFVLNDMALRGVLGQSFIELGHKTFSNRLIHSMLQLTGLTISFLFGSYWLSYISRPPPQSPIRSYDDLLRSPLKFAIPDTDFVYLHNVTNGSLAKYYSIFHIMRNFKQFYHLRDTLDRRYAYYTTSSYVYKVSSFELRYSIKLVRINENMCPIQGTPWFAPLLPNSYYRQPFNIYILRIWQSGLFEYWRSKTYVDTLEAGQPMKFNVTAITGATPLTANDFLWLWVIYGLLSLLAMLVFLAELIASKIIKSQRNINRFT